MGGAKIMKHYTNKNTLQVYGYDNDEVARQYNDDYRNLILMSDELLQEYRKQPIGGKWTLKGWVIDENEVNRYELEQLKLEEQKLKQELIIEQALGSDISSIVNRIKEIRSILNQE